MCVKEPCPRIGIVPVPEDGAPRRSWPVYSGRTPPRLEGPEADRVRAEGAWSADACLVVEGALLRDPPRFTIRRVLRDCRH